MGKIQHKEKRMTDLTIRAGVVRPGVAPEARLQARAADLESAFLSEMLGFSGLLATESAFGGGAGEAQFASFLRDEYARKLVARGGLGLGQAFVDAMRRGVDNGE
ncbi:MULTISPECIES: rod-binding protein [Gemmobacter]|nr:MULTISPECIES: rod-binding protein [Gemmobacter]